ncbi:hypothetical protein P280DRAFT_484693 [Massarina eburnea CBS 473.64]|uniref:Uncharacterized protein n=1 Tax=Massarina eburnea CBS 473.64 TaxID=1395130 RepID=A0A6A6RJH9_9PLEO|nr:hypothetical protein P280DRAFT_484693 [Massarina eburnea CBS 473.64]
MCSLHIVVHITIATTSSPHLTYPLLITSPSPATNALDLKSPQHQHTLREAFECPRWRVPNSPEVSQSTRQLVFAIIERLRGHRRHLYKDEDIQSLQGGTDNVEGMATIDDDDVESYEAPVSPPSLHNSNGERPLDDGAMYKEWVKYTDQCNRLQRKIEEYGIRKAEKRKELEEKRAELEEMDKKEEIMRKTAEVLRQKIDELIQGKDLKWLTDQAINHRQ